MIAPVLSATPHGVSTTVGRGEIAIGDAIGSTAQETTQVGDTVADELVQERRLILDWLKGCFF